MPRAHARVKSVVINARFIRGRVSSRGVKALVIPRRRRFPSRSDFVIRHALTSRECKTGGRVFSGFARRVVASCRANFAQIPEHGRDAQRYPPSPSRFPPSRSRGALKFTPGYSSGNLTAPGRRFLPLCIPYYCCYVARRVA